MFGQAERVLEFSRYSTGISKGGNSKIFAFTSGKGGTGKTFLSINIAHALSGQYKVLYIDFDQNLSNANIMINEIPERTILDFFSGKCLLAETIKEYEPNLHFIFGDSGRLSYPRVKKESVLYFFNQLNNILPGYDFVFIDTGSGAGDDIFSILTNADVNVIVTTPEPTAVMDGYVMIKLLNAHNYSGKKTVLINKCSDEKEGMAAFSNLSSAAGHFLNEKLNLLGTITNDKAVNGAIMAQEPVLKHAPVSAVCRQIQAVSENLYEFAHMANIHQS